MTLARGRDPHEVLGVARGASLAAVRAAYRKQARALHPDSSGDPATAEEFREVVSAFQAVLALKPGSLETHPLWHALSELDAYWARELGYTTSEGLEDWLVTTGKMEDYVEEAELAAAAEASDGSEEEASAAGIAALTGYRFLRGNEQWRVMWRGLDGETACEESWEVFGVLDTAPLRSEAERLRALGQSSAVDENTGR